jgi:WD40 repeat protein
VGIPALLAGVGVAAWYFWPREPLPPERIGTILDRATAGTFLNFNDGASGRQTLLLSTGTDIWEVPGGKSRYQGTELGYFLSSDGETVFMNGGLFNWRTKKSTRLENPAPQQFQFGLTRFSSDGTMIAAARPNGSLHLFDTATGKVIHALEVGGSSISDATDAKQNCYVTSLAFSRDGATLASGDLNGNITLWSTDTGDLRNTLRGEDSQPCDTTVLQALDPNRGVLAVAFSPNGHLLASEDIYGVIRIWQVSTGKVLHTLPFHFVRPQYDAAKFSPDGRFLVTSGGTPSNDELYLVWDVSGGRLLRAFSLLGPGTVDFLPDGDLVVAQASKGRVKAERWLLRSRFRIPFFSSAQERIGPSDPALLHAYEDEGIGSLGRFQFILGRYMAGNGKGGFPTRVEDLSKVVQGLRTDFFRQEMCGYRYVYTPGPPDDQGHIASYVLSARPLLYQQTGKRSFLVDQTGQVHVTEEVREATTSDAVFRSLQDATQVAASIQNAAAAAAQQEIAPHLARAQMLFEQRQYQAAITECDAVLRLDSSNQQAVNLKSQIQQTMSILGVQ